MKCKYLSSAIFILFLWSCSTNESIPDFAISRQSSTVALLDVAVTLSKKFGEDGDYKFINALLDKTI